MMKLLTHSLKCKAILAMIFACLLLLVAGKPDTTISVDE